MLEAAQKFERALNRYEEIDPLYRSELDVDHGDGVLGLEYQGCLMLMIGGFVEKWLAC